MLESLFNKVAGLNFCNFLQKRLQHMCFPVRFGGGRGCVGGISKETSGVKSVYVSTEIKQN